MLASYVTLYFVPLKISPTSRSLEGADGSWARFCTGRKAAPCGQRRSRSYPIFPREKPREKQLEYTNPCASEKPHRCGFRGHLPCSRGIVSPFFPFCKSEIAFSAGIPGFCFRRAFTCKSR